MSAAGAGNPEVSFDTRPVYDAVVLAALKEKELGPFLKHLDEGSQREVELAGMRYTEGTINGRKTAVVHCGLGRQQSGEIMQFMLQHCRIGFAGLIGCAGVVKGSSGIRSGGSEVSTPDLGDVMLGMSYYSDLYGIVPMLTGTDYEEGNDSIHKRPDGERTVLTHLKHATPKALSDLALSSSVTESFGVYEASVFSSDTFPVGPGFKKFALPILEKEGCVVIALDMESESVARKCYLARELTKDVTSAETRRLVEKDGRTYEVLGEVVYKHDGPVPFIMVKGNSNFVNEKGEDSGEGFAAKEAFTNAALVMKNLIANAPMISTPSCTGAEKASVNLKDLMNNNPKAFHRLIECVDEYVRVEDDKVKSRVYFDRQFLGSSNPLDIGA